MVWIVIYLYISAIYFGLLTKYKIHICYFYSYILIVMKSCTTDFKQNVFLVL
jgi:hypothetical protein